MTDALVKLATLVEGGYFMVLQREKREDQREKTGVSSPVYLSFLKFLTYTLLITYTQI